MRRRGYFGHSSTLGLSRRGPKIGALQRPLTNVDWYATRSLPVHRINVPLKTIRAWIGKRYAKDPARARIAREVLRFIVKHPAEPKIEIAARVFSELRYKIKKVPYSDSRGITTKDFNISAVEKVCIELLSSKFITRASPQNKK